MQTGKQGDLDDKFVAFVRTKQLFDPAHRVLLAVSGGLDSVVMAELFRKAGFLYAIAHVNFQLRGADSEEDVVFVRALAERHQVPFYTVCLPPGRQADEQGVSTQMAARQLRYAWFEKVAQESGFQCVATAHHQDDVFETILLNLVRGTGLTGLRGIPMRQGRIIRPLWFTDRTSIQEYAETNNLSWREDTSNASDYYRRNQLRHQVIPVLKTINPGLLQTTQSTIARLQSADHLIDQEIQRSWEALAQIRSDGIFLSIAKLVALVEWEFRLSEWLKSYGFQYVQISPIVEAIQATGFGQVFLSSTHRVFRDREFLIITPRLTEEKFEIPLAQFPAHAVNVFDLFSLHFELIGRTDDFQLPTDPATACFDADRIPWPLTIRRWQEGDRFRPLGLNGSQTVGNFLTNRKVPLFDRRSIFVLTSGEQIVWLIGYRPDDRFRVTDTTQKVLKIELRSKH